MSDRGENPELAVVPSSTPPENATLVDDFTPALIDVGAHNLCPGCGEPIGFDQNREFGFGGGKNSGGRE